MSETDQARFSLLRHSGLLEPEARASFQRFARLASSLLHMPTALITLLDENRQVFLSQCGMSEPWQSRCETPLEYSYCQSLLLEPGPLVVEDSLKDQRFRDHPGRQKLSIGAYAGVPLRVNNLVLGALCVIDSQGHKFDQTHLDLLNDLADSVVSEIRLRLTAQALEHSQAHLTALLHQAPLGVFELCDQTGTVRHGNPMAGRMLGHLPEQLVGQQISDWVHPEDKHNLEAMDALWQRKRPRCELEARFLRNGQEPFWGRLHASLVSDPGHRSIVLALLEDITDYREAMHKLVVQAKELEELSLTDSLTGLTNRRGFLSIGKKLMLVFERKVESGAVIFIDLNDLKKTNDSLGHDVGDEMLREFAQVLKETFRQADLVARLGGDEFAMLAANLEPSQQQLLTDRLDAHLAAITDKPYRLVCAMGFAYFNPKQDKDLEGLLKQADALMYEDKKRRKLGRA